MQLNNTEKRWLEINFYLLCTKIYKNRNNYHDLVNFFKAFEWTNLYDSATLIKTISVVLEPNARPSNYEFTLHLGVSDCRFKYDNYALNQLAKDIDYKYSKNAIYITQLKEEVKEVKTPLYPKFNIPKFHEAYYSFLLTLKYMGGLYGKNIKL